jgi:thiol-disulfide isomerase/thioredoxin
MTTHLSSFSAKYFLLLVGIFFIGFRTQAQQVGAPAPEITLQSIEGTQVSLSDFKGKVVLIDFWATWCKPCVAEIPYSKKLKEKYANNTDIVFLYISIDPEASKWEKFVKSKKIQGTHLIVPHEQKDYYIEHYNVVTIPRFLLVDKKGNIANADAPWPHSSELKEQIDLLLAAE